ncbi:MAG: hypothetical protein HY290_24325 [Planctomycetia bacterium]|nr:hypothetical protein [Planctomycetia bacterium]
MAAVPPPPTAVQSPRAAFIQWLIIGTAGVGFVFVAATHLPDGIKLPGVLTVGLGAAAGWGWGRFGRSLEIGRSALVPVIVFVAIAAAELLATWKQHEDRAADLGKKWLPHINNPIAVEVREQLERAPEGETAEQREARLKQLADMDRADARRLERLEFRGYLTSRMERLTPERLRTQPWPWIVWAAEILLGSAAGAWLAFGQMRTRSASGETRLSV